MDDLPAAPSGSVNVKWQADAVTVNPRKASAYVGNTGKVDPRTTTTETIGIASRGKDVTLSNSGAIAVTLDSTVPLDFLCAVQVIGAGSATLTPSSGQINSGAGLAANAVMAATQSGWLFFDGTNWFLLVASSSGGTGGLNGAVVKTADYTLLSGDNGKLLVMNSGSAHQFTLPNPPPSATWSVFLSTIGTGALTINRNSQNIDGVAANLTLSQFQGVFISTDGTNYFTDGHPSGFTAGGDLSGSSTSQEVIGILSTLFDSPGTAWADGQIAQYSSSLGKLIRVVDRPIFPVSGVGGKPSAGQLVGIYTAGASFIFPANFASPNSYGTVGTNPTATATYSVYKNGSLIGTIAVSTSGVFTFATSGGVSVTFNAGDRLTIVAPGSQDATMQDVGITLVGTRSATVPATAVPPIFTWRGTYAGGTTYQPFDVVAYTVSSKVQSYVCIATTTGNVPTNTSFWDLLAQAGADGAAGGVQIANDLGGTNLAPTVIATHLSSPLPVSQGGTGAATLGAHGVLVGEGTSAVAVTGAGTAGQVLTSNGASADPTFQAAAGGGIPPIFGTGNKRWEGIWRSGSSTEKPMNGVDNANSPAWVAGTTSLPPFIHNWGSGWVMGQLALLTGKNIHSYHLGRIEGTGLTTTTRVWVGISDGTTNSGSGSDTPAGKFAMFRYSHNAGDTNWKCITSDGSTLTVTDSGVAADTNPHTFEIQFNDSTPNVVFSIDGSVVQTITTHLPGNGVLVRRGWAVDGGSSLNDFAEYAFYVQQDPTWP